MPFIYYGDEYAMAGGEDPDCRRGMLWDESRQDADMFAWYRELIRIRKSNPAITEGKVTSCICDDVQRKLVLTRECESEKVSIAFDFKQYTVEVKNF